MLLTKRWLRTDQLDFGNDHRKLFTRYKASTLVRYDDVLRSRFEYNKSNKSGRASIDSGL